MESGLNQVAEVERKIKKLHLKGAKDAKGDSSQTKTAGSRPPKKGKSYYVKERASKIAELLTALAVSEGTDTPQEEQESDEKLDANEGIFHVRQMEPVGPPEWNTEMPAWASKSAINGRGKMTPSLSHYFGVVQVGNAVTDTILDTGGARSMVEAGLARELGLKVEKASKNNIAGCFWGPNGKKMYYYGKVRGPI